MANVSNEYTEDDFTAYFEERFGEIRSILSSMQEATDKILDSLDPKDGFNTIESGARDVVKILRETHRDCFYHSQTSETFSSERNKLALKVSRSRRKREKNARNTPSAG